MFDEASPYKKRKYQIKEEQEYYTLREIMEKYHIGRKAVWGRCDRMGIPKVYEGRNTFFSKKAVDVKFADLLEEINLHNYYTMDQVMDMYGMTRTNAMSLLLIIRYQELTVMVRLTIPRYILIVSSKRQ